MLAVDADPNSTLALALGVRDGQTIADLRDRMGEAAESPTQIPKDRLMDQWLAELICENEGFDLLTMGRPEGPKCYCYVNGLLRRYLQLLRSNYPCVVVDCEAGMEFLSRLVVEDVDALVLVAEATAAGLATARRISALTDSLAIRVRRRILAINKVPPGAPACGPAAEMSDVQAVVRIAFDEDLAGRSARGQPLDDDAGPLARPAVRQLTNYCTAPLHQAAAKTVKETR